MALGVAAVSPAPAAAARADDRRAALAVLTAQIATTQQEQALNACLVASPNRNTACIRRQALLLAALDARQITLITRAMDGTERACVRTVVRQEIAILTLWKTGALALSRNERKKAKSLFVKSLPIDAAQRRIQPRCFARVLAGR